MTTHRSPSWNELQTYFDTKAKSTQIKDLFNADPTRFETFSFNFQAPDGQITWDFSKNILDGGSLKLLQKLAEEANVEKLRARLFAGDAINFTEDRYGLNKGFKANLLVLYTTLLCAM